MRRHTVLKLAGRLENPSERYSVGWQEWMRRAYQSPMRMYEHVDIYLDGVRVTEEATLPVDKAVACTIRRIERAIYST